MDHDIINGVPISLGGIIGQFNQEYFEYRQLKGNSAADVVRFSCDNEPISSN